MITLLCMMVNFVLIYLLVSSLLADFYYSPSRFSVLRKMIFNGITSLFPYVSRVVELILLALMFSILVINLTGAIPLSTIGTMYYFFTVSVSLTIWVSMMVVVFKTQLFSFLAHMLPYGSPSALMLFLPLVEIFSQFIRPLTLMIRLSTNLSSGHIMLFMFSYFSLSSFMMSSGIFLFLTALYLLELAIAALQAYIFSSLAYLYFVETI